MRVAVALLAGAVATMFFFDLLRGYRRAPRPHAAAYTAGIGFYAIATWALFVGTAFGWTSASYRIFFLFGAIINIPILALGSMFLVVGKRAGHVMLALLFPFMAIAIPMTMAQPFDAGSLPADGVPGGREVWAEMFGPRLWAAIGGGMGATILVVLALVSVVRFWKKNPRLVLGNVTIVVGALVAATGGTVLALGFDWGFSASLLVAVTLIWVGFRVAVSARRAVAT